MTHDGSNDLFDREYPFDDLEIDLPDEETYPSIWFGDVDARKLKINQYYPDCKHTVKNIILAEELPEFTFNPIEGTHTSLYEDTCPYCLSLQYQELLEQHIIAGRKLYWQNLLGTIASAILVCAMSVIMAYLHNIHSLVLMLINTLFGCITVYCTPPIMNLFWPGKYEPVSLNACALLLLGGELIVVGTGAFLFFFQGLPW